MGGCISRNNKESSSSSPSGVIKIKVVHYNGYLENYEDPITAGQVTANVSKHFLCTPTQLLLQDLKPLMPDTQLQSGQIYFLLPYSALRFKVSAVDLASISKKLTTVAKSGISLSKSPSGHSEGRFESPAGSPYRSSSIRSYSGRSSIRIPNPLVSPSPASPYKTSPSPRMSKSSKQPNRYSNIYAVARRPSPSEAESSPIRNGPESSPIRNGPESRSPHRYPDRYVLTGEDTVSDLQLSTMKSPSWKPMLSTIRERSVDQRSESDLQNNVQIPKLD